MNIRRTARYATKPAFWRAFGSGFRSSWNAPKNRARYNASFRMAVYPAIIGSAVVLQWTKRTRVTAGRPPLTTAQELGVSAIGAFGAVALIYLFLWARRRWIVFRPG